MWRTVSVMSNTTATVALPPGVEPEYTADEVAAIFKRSRKWLNNLMATEPVEYTRRGNRVIFTATQVKKLQDRHATVTRPKPRTAGKKT